LFTQVICDLAQVAIAPYNKVGSRSAGGRKMTPRRTRRAKRAFAYALVAAASFALLAASALKLAW
jgi:hypothetical protein